MSELLISSVTFFLSHLAGSNLGGLVPGILSGFWIFYFLIIRVWGDILGDAQGLLLAVLKSHSWCLEDRLWYRDQTTIGCIQGKHLNPVLSLWPPKSFFSPLVGGDLDYTWWCSEAIPALFPRRDFWWGLGDHLKCWRLNRDQWDWDARHVP